MNEVTRTIQEVLFLVNGSYSSVFTKQDVLDLIQSIEVKKEPIVTKESLIKFVTEYVETQVDQLNSEDVLDQYSAEFRLDGNEICLDDINLDKDQLNRELLGDVDDAVDTFLNYDL